MAQKSSKLTGPASEGQRKLVDEAIERLDKLAESQLEMARLFIDRGKPEIARRRLQEVVELYSKTDAANEAKQMLKAIRALPKRCATQEEFDSISRRHFSMLDRLNKHQQGEKIFTLQKWAA